MTIDVSDRDMDRAALDAAYNNSAAVPDSAAQMRTFGERSAALRAALPGYRALVWGPAPRNRIDCFPADQPGPLLVFIHGGYWQMRAKEDFSFVAAGPLAHGVHVAMPGYTLAPYATLTAIAQEIHRSIDYLHRIRANDLPQVAADRSIVSGWSAGEHLAALCLDPSDLSRSLCREHAQLHPVSTLSNPNYRACLLQAASAQRRSSALTPIPCRTTLPTNGRPCHDRCNQQTQHPRHTTVASPM